MSILNDYLNVLIVDDEENACTNLQNILKEFVDAAINVVGVAYDTEEAEKLIAKLNPDAIFLDIEMADENAFSFLTRLMPFTFEVVFVTAYDEYAVKAFRLNAVDYILKPISIYELRTAIQRLRDKIKYKSIITQNTPYTDLADQVTNKIKSTKITIKDPHNKLVVDFNDIHFIEAHGSYARILFTQNIEVKEITVSSPLSDYEELLPANLFFRIHRSYLINCTHIKKIVNDGTSQVIMRGDEHLPISRRRYLELREFLKENNL